MRSAVHDDGRVVVAAWCSLAEHPLFAALGEVELRYLRPLGAELGWAEIEAPFSLGDRDSLAVLFTDAGFRSVTISRESVDARFAEADRFIEHLERGYAAVVPALAADPAAFETFVQDVTRAADDVVRRHRFDGEIVVPMHTWVVVARP